MSTHANMVKMTVTSVASAGVGTITLNAASSGYQSLGTAYGGNATVDILITEGTAWEVARNCTYTHSGTTVTRGTLESSSTGSAVAFTSAAVVSVVATADSGRRWDSAAVDRVAGTDANVTMVLGSNYMVDMSAWATADRNYTLPAATGSGRRIRVQILGGNASYELILKTDAAGVCKFNNSSIASSTEITRLFITGETMTFLDDAANVWKCEQDDRIACNCVMQAASAQTSIAGSTWTTLTQGASGSWAIPINVGGIADTGSNAAKARRAGNYLLSITMALALLPDQKDILLGFQKNGAGNPFRVCRLSKSSAYDGTTGGGGGTTYALAVDDYLKPQILHTGPASLSTSYIAGEDVVCMSMTEVL